MTGRYVERLETLLGLVDNPEGSHLDVLVQHDAGCALLAGSGPCGCSPQVEMAGTDGNGNAVKLAVLEYGTLWSS